MIEAIYAAFVLGVLIVTAFVTTLAGALFGLLELGLALIGLAYAWAIVEKLIEGIRWLANRRAVALRLKAGKD